MGQLADKVISTQKNKALYYDTRQKYGAIYLDFSNSSYLPNNKVTATIHAYIKEPFVGKKLRIRIFGKQKYKFNTPEPEAKERQTSPTSSNSLTSKSEEIKIIFDKVATIFTAPQNTIEPGYYTYPFYFKLPAEVPPTLDWTDGSNYAKTYYKIAVYFENPDGDKNSPKLYYKYPLFVKAALKLDTKKKDQKLDENQQQKSPHISIISTCCKKTEVAAKVTPQEGQIAHRRAMFAIDIDNSKNDKRIEQLQLELLQKVQFYGDNGKLSYEKTYPVGVCELSQPLIKKGRIHIGQKALLARIRVDPPGYQNQSPSTGKSKSSISDIQKNRSGALDSARNRGSVLDVSKNRSGIFEPSKNKSMAASTGSGRKSAKVADLSSIQNHHLKKSKINFSGTTNNDESSEIRNMGTKEEQKQENPGYMLQNRYLPLITPTVDSTKIKVTYSIRLTGLVRYLLGTGKYLYMQNVHFGALEDKKDPKEVLKLHAPKDIQPDQAQPVKVLLELDPNRRRGSVSSDKISKVSQEDQQNRAKSKFLPINQNPIVISPRPDDDVKLLADPK